MKFASIIFLFYYCCFEVGLARSTAFLDSSSSDKLGDRLSQHFYSQSPSNRAECTESYAPCTCDVDSVFGVSVTCSDLLDPLPVQNALNRTTTQDIGSLTINNFNFPSIPANFLSGKRSRRIILKGGTNRITIDSEAFRSSSGFTEIFDIVFMTDMSNVDFVFLADFNSLQSLALLGNSVGTAASIPSLPPLPSLKELILVQSDLNQIGANFPDISPATIERLWLYGNRLTDATLESILSKILSSSSGSSLTQLDIHSNALTVVPKIIESFPQLNYLSIDQNQITEISSNDFSFTSPVQEVIFSKNPIGNSFQAGAFNGDYSGAMIYAESVGMTTLAETVFKGVIQQMTNNNGRLLLTLNYFECDCNLAWLLRDNRQLLNVVENAICTDGLFFQNTTSNQFQSCP